MVKATPLMANVSRLFEALSGLDRIIKDLFTAIRHPENINIEVAVIPEKDLCVLLGSAGRDFLIRLTR